MKFLFVQEMIEDEGFIIYVDECCDGLWRKIAKRTKLIVEAERLGQIEVAGDTLECLQETHEREIKRLAASTDILIESREGIF